MTGDTDAWAAGFGLPPRQASALARLAAAMGSDPAGMIRLMVERVIAMDGDMRGLGLRGIAYRASGREGAEAAAGHGLDGLPLDIRTTGFMWPPDAPFPWSAEECRAAVLGHQVRWTGDFDDFLNRLRGEWEMSDGYALLLQR